MSLFKPIIRMVTSSPEPTGKPDVESLIQHILRTNSVSCLCLNYDNMAVHMMRKGALTENTHGIIQSKYRTNTDRIGALLDYLKQENSVDTFLTFIECCQLVGQSNLAMKLDKELKNLSPVYKALQIPEILKAIISFLPQDHLLKARVVSRNWNALATERLAKIGEISFTWGTGTQVLRKFVSGNPNSPFLSAFRKFNFIQVVGEDEVYYLEFFRKYGAKIKSIRLANCLISSEEANSVCGCFRDYDFVKFFFSKPVQSLLGPVESLVLGAHLNDSYVKSEAFSAEGLNQLKSLTVRATEIQSDYGQISFLQRYISSPKQLRELAILRHFCIGTLPKEIYANFFKNFVAESFESSEVYNAVSDESLKAMTVKAGTSKLKYLTLYLASDVTAPTLHRFLVSHRLSLRSVNLENVTADLIESIPDGMMTIVKVKGCVRRRR